MIRYIIVVLSLVIALFIAACGVIANIWFIYYIINST